MLPATASAQDCAGFVDVQTTDIFCDAVQWLRNRAVTLGCTATQYCPTDNVTRAQMALFMQRLGDALTPAVVRTTGSGGGPYNPSLHACVSVPIPTGTFPRKATLAATIVNSEATGDKQITANLAYSTDNGTTWNDTPDAAMGQSIDVDETSTMAVNGGAFAMSVGTTYRFAVRLSSATTGTASHQCQLAVRIDNRTSPTAPF